MGRPSRRKWESPASKAKSNNEAELEAENESLESFFFRWKFTSSSSSGAVEQRINEFPCEKKHIFQSYIRRERERGSFCFPRMAFSTKIYSFVRFTGKSFYVIFVLCFGHRINYQNTLNAPP
jgi:hypothetical protein